jgi:hypothetical protein
VSHAIPSASPDRDAATEEATQDTALSKTTVLDHVSPMVGPDGNLRLSQGEATPSDTLAFVEDLLLTGDPERVLRVPAVLRPDADALYAGLWFRTSGLAEVMKISRDDARALVRDVCMPRGPAKKNGGRYYARVDALPELIDEYDYDE